MSIRSHQRAEPERLTRLAPRLTALALALLTLCAPAVAVDYVWRGNVGNWEDANQWTLLGVPGASDSALLGGGTAFVNAAASVGSLLIDRGRLAGPGALAVGSLNFQRGAMGTEFCPCVTGSTTVAGTSSFNGALDQGVGPAYTLRLQGNAVWSAGDGALNGAGTVVNAATAVFSDQGASSASSYRALRDNGGSYFGGTFLNQGSYVRSGLGLTLAYGFDNSGSVQVQSGTFELRDNAKSSGVINVAVGAVLNFNGDANISGRINNAGQVVFERGNATLTSSARLDGGGAVRILDSAVVNDGTHFIRSLTLDGGGQLVGTGTVTASSFDFRRGNLGGTTNFYPVGSTTINGPATFDGSRSQGVGRGHTLTLLGASRWTAGDGSISSAVFGGDIINAAGASFVDEGAGLGTATKQLRKDTANGGGVFINDGSYTRTGLGRTVAYGFDNRGLLRVDSGVFEFDGRFSNTGRVLVAAGATLRARDTNPVNSGLMGGLGTLQTRGGFGDAGLFNVGRLDPGSEAGVGTFSISGDLVSGNNGRLRIDLVGAGSGDRLVITGSVLWRGDLDVFAAPGAQFAIGESYVISTFAQRANNSVFDRVNWSGVDGSFFSVEYGAQNITLRVTAVPEPATWALALLSAPLFVGALRRRQRAIAA